MAYKMERYDDVPPNILAAYKVTISKTVIWHIAKLAPNWWCVERFVNNRSLGTSQFYTSQKLCIKHITKYENTINPNDKC
jgi:hypothetical protein